MTIQLDASKMSQRRCAHEYLKELLDFPDYYGMNLDALYDCLREMPELEVQFINTENSEPYYQKIRRVFEDAARRDENIRILDDFPADAE